jgi:hypothetical protein
VLLIFFKALAIAYCDTDKETNNIPGEELVLLPEDNKQQVKL